MVFWILWIAVIGLVFWLGPTPFIGRTRREPERVERSAVVQILFAEREGDVLDVDCMALEPFGVGDRLLPAGFLFSLFLDPPEDGLLATVACNTISDWAASESVVKMRLIKRDGLACAKFTDEQTSLQLDLEAAVG